MAKNIKDLPTSVIVNLDEETAVKYPKNGEFEEAYQLELMCFGRNQYIKTWPLRQRLMLAMAKMSFNLSGASASVDEAPEQDNDAAMTADDLKNMCFMGEFDLLAALEEFKQFAISGKLIKLEDDVYLNKERWEMMDDLVKEEVLFTYLANFIQPCVQ